MTPEKYIDIRKGLVQARDEARRRWFAARNVRDNLNQTPVRETKLLMTFHNGSAWITSEFRSPLIPDYIVELFVSHAKKLADEAQRVLDLHDSQFRNGGSDDETDD